MVESLIEAIANTVYCYPDSLGSASDWAANMTACVLAGRPAEWFSTAEAELYTQLRMVYAVERSSVAAS